jgi:hypothetical protein
MKLSYFVLFLLVVSSIAALAQEPPSDNKHGIMVRAAQIYIAPDATTAKLGEVGLGREVTVLDQSREWVQVLASVTPERDITGWILNKGIIHIDTPDGPKILFGVAAANELEASRRNARKDAADDARRLYYRVFDYFPKSDLAGEGLYRAADILWQIEAADVNSRPARNREVMDRPEITETYMKLVKKKFPGTKWADMAEFHLIENKLCNDWLGESKCPDKEAGIYEKYAAEHPDSPRAAEALYDAATRRAALIEIYKTENKSKQIDESHEKAKADCSLAITKYGTTDWALRARALAYMIDQGIPTYGNASVQ